MRLLTILTISAFILTACVFTAYACWVNAFATASVGNNNAYCRASINASRVKRGGYYITCTGRKPRAMAFHGKTNDSLTKYFTVRIKVTAMASIGGSCHRGGGVQDYDFATAGP